MVPVLFNTTINLLFVFINLFQIKYLNLNHFEKFLIFLYLFNIISYLYISFNYKIKVL